jgi:hypothetical protein
MADPDKALETQLRNIQTRTGKSLDELRAIVEGSGLARHGEKVAMLKRDLGMGHGDANTLVHHLAKAAAPPAEAVAAAEEATGAAYYTGAKAPLQPIHDAVMSRVSALGPFEVAPKKTYLSLRRKKQFATVGPATNTQVEVGLNAKDLEPTGRLVRLPPGGMCQYRVRLSDPHEVDDELIGWIRRAYDAAG